ncbi:MAG: Rrf2 family transcriptional regulator [Dehalococcoidia bacterium]
MDIALTSRADYTLRAAIGLAKAGPDAGYRKIREIADEMAIPARYTPEILNLLQRAGIAEARAGRQGGYRLKRAPAEITVLEIIEAAEGPLVSERCVLSGGPCHWQDTICAAHPAIEEAGTALTRALRHHTLQSILKMDERLRSANVQPAN